MTDLTQRSAFGGYRYRRICTGALLAVAPLLANAGFIASSLEQYNYQTGSSTLTVRSYDAFDEISGPDEFPGVTGLKVKVNAAPPQNIPFDPFYQAFKRRQSWGSAADMVAARPIDATIVHGLQGSPAGLVTITAPGVTYADGIPTNPLFGIGGIGGYWTQDAQGRGVFNFNATGPVNSFTLNLNSYAARIQGANFFSSIIVGDIRGAYARVGQLESGLLAAGDPSPPLSITFTRGLPLDGGDADPATYGFGMDSYLLLEGEFANIFGISDAGLGDGSQKAFVFQNNTGLLLRAATQPAATSVSQPATAALLGVWTLLVGFARRKPLPAR